MIGRRGALIVVVLCVLIVPACRMTDLRLWWPGPTRHGEAMEFSRHDYCYYDGPDADLERHRLDLFIPRGARNAPVVILVHGGAWSTGDNRCCGLYSSVGEFLAGQGIVTVLPNYRLSPGVRHPEHIRDIARAFAWTFVNASKIGGSPERIFLVGHSAGGHLVSLLATHDRWLGEHNLSPTAIRGVVAISGVYDLPPATLQVTLGGTSPDAVHAASVFPFRSGNSWVPRLEVPVLPVTVDVYGPAFGDDPIERKLASPLYHVRKGLPPFMLLHAEDELPTLVSMAEDFHRELERHGCRASLACVRNRNHSSVMFRAVSLNDPVADAILGFIQEHSP